MKKYRVEVGSALSIAMHILCFLLIYIDCLTYISLRVRLIITMIGFLFLLLLLYKQSSFGSAFYTLQIDATEIRIKWLGFINACSIQRDNIYIHSFKYKGKWYRVFSDMPVNSLSPKQLSHLAKQRQVIIFPLIQKMDADFPDLFATDQANPYQNSFFLKPHGSKQ